MVLISESLRYLCSEILAVCFHSLSPFIDNKAHFMVIHYWFCALEYFHQSILEGWKNQQKVEYKFSFLDRKGSKDQSKQHFFFFYQILSWKWEGPHTSSLEIELTWSGMDIWCQIRQSDYILIIWSLVATNSLLELKTIYSQECRAKWVRDKGNERNIHTHTI